MYSSGHRFFALMAATVMLVVSFSVAFAFDADESDAYTPKYSDGFYFSELNKDEQTLYKQILEFVDIIDEKEEVMNIIPSLYEDGKGPAISCATRVMRAVMFDHPEIFWINWYTFLNHPAPLDPEKLAGITIYSVLKEAGDKEKLKAQIDNVVNSIVVDAEFTYGKVKQIHDWIVGNVQYDVESAHSKETVVEAHTIYGALVNKTCVCEGYAKTMVYLCRLNEIDAMVDDGPAKSTADSKSEEHMWNYIRMDDDKGYCLDATWDDPLRDGKDTGNIYYDYFLVGMKTVNRGLTFHESHLDEIEEKWGFTMPDDISDEAYRFNPDDVEHLDYVLPADGNLQKTFTLNVADIDEYREIAGTGGNVLIRTSEGFSYRFSVEDLKKVEESLVAAGITEMTFGGAVEKRNVKCFARYGILGDYTREMDVYVPYVSVTPEQMGLKEIDIGIKTEKSKIDFDFFMKAWDLSDPEKIKPLKCQYSDGYEYFSTSSLSAFCIGHNPITPATDLPFIVIIGLILIGLFVIYILLRMVLKRRKIKKMAKKMAKSQRNMDHYQKMYDDGKLTSRERKAFVKAKDIYSNKKKK